MLMELSLSSFFIRREVAVKPKVKWYKLRWRVILLCLLIITAAFGYVGWRFYNALRLRPTGTGPAGAPVGAGPV